MKITKNVPKPVKLPPPTFTIVVNEAELEYLHQCVDNAEDECIPKGVEPYAIFDTLDRALNHR